MNRTPRSAGTDPPTPQEPGQNTEGDCSIWLYFLVVHLCPTPDRSSEPSCEVALGWGAHSATPDTALSTTMLEGEPTQAPHPCGMNPKKWPGTW